MLGDRCLRKRKRFYDPAARRFAAFLKQLDDRNARRMSQRSGKIRKSALFPGEIV